MDKSFDDNSAGMSDNELISLVADGKYEYLQIIIDRYMPVIIKTAKSFAFSGIDVEDLIQEGILAVFSAVKSFDESKSKFSTFVTLCINRKMSSAVKVVNASKRVPENMISSIDDVVLTLDDDPESIYINKENYERFKEQISTSLSELEYAVLCRFVDGKSYGDIAKELGISLKSVDNSLTRIRNKLSH